MATTARKVVIGTLIAVVLALLISAAVIFSHSGRKPSDSWVAYNHGHKHGHHGKHGKHGRRYSSGDGFKERGKDLPKFLDRALGPDGKAVTRTVSASMVAAAAKPTVAGVFTVTAPAVAVCAPPPPVAPCTATAKVHKHHHHRHHHRHHKVKVTKATSCCTSKTKSYVPRSTGIHKHRKAWKTATKSHHKVKTTTKSHHKTKTSTSCCPTKTHHHHHHHHTKSHHKRKIPDSVAKDEKKKKKGNIFTRFARKVKGIFKTKKNDSKKSKVDEKKKGKKCVPCKKAKKVGTTTTAVAATTTTTHKHHHHTTTTKTHKVKHHHKKDHKVKKHHHKKGHKVKATKTHKHTHHHKKDHKVKKHHHKKGHCDRKIPKSVAKEADKKQGVFTKLGHAIKKGFRKVKNLFKKKKDSKKEEKKKRGKKAHKKEHHKKAKKAHKKEHKKGKKCVPCKKAKKVTQTSQAVSTTVSVSDYKTAAQTQSTSTATATATVVGAQFDRAVKQAGAKAKKSTRQFLRPDGSKVNLTTTVVDKMLHDGKLPFNQFRLRFRCAPKIAKGEWHIIKGQSYKCVGASKEEALERAAQHRDDGLVLVVPPEQGGDGQYKICVKKAATAAVRN